MWLQVAGGGLGPTEMLETEVFWINVSWLIDLMWKYWKSRFKARVQLAYCSSLHEDADFPQTRNLQLGTADHGNVAEMQRPRSDALFMRSGPSPSKPHLPYTTHTQTAKCDRNARTHADMHNLFTCNEAQNKNAWCDDGVSPQTHDI